VVWARSKIETVMDAVHAGANEDDIRASVIEVALAHHLVSRYTSLVAIDTTPSAPANVDAMRSLVRTNAPEGGDTIIGELPRTATPAPLHIALGAVALLLASMLALLVRSLAFIRRR